MIAGLPKGSDLVEIARGKLFTHEEFPEEVAKHAASFLASLAWTTPPAGAATVAD